VVQQLLWGVGWEGWLVGGLDEVVGLVVDGWVGGWGLKVGLGVPVCGGQLIQQPAVAPNR